MLITNGTLLTMGDNPRVIPGGAVYCEEDTIIEVGSTAELTAKHRHEQILDAEGKIVTDGSGNRVPGPAKPLGPPPRHPSQGYSFYDESRGHCGLCGRLTCNGRCFK